MRGFAIGLVFGFVLMAGGCATQPTVIEGGIRVSPKVRDTIQAIQKACQYAPAVASVVKLVSTAPVAVTAVQLASEVCLAISTVPLAEGGTKTVKVRGVVITGRKL